ncbi:hypothetical protein GCM10022234_00040 [Aeromicrobium panaciterrae]|uniref:hypothetical protein n=1 Tax=Aeromicrobium panaciterrae TaxID=363861 RepID=UPI0031D96C2E
MFLTKKKLNAAVLARYWKAFAGFFAGAVVPLVGPLTQGEWPVAADYRMSLGFALSAAFLVGISPKNAE